MPEKISIKTREEIEIMKKGGQIAAAVLEKIKNAVRPGVTTQDLNKIAEKEIIKKGGLLSFKGFSGYPAGTCISVNDEVVHGIPSGRILKEKDLVGIDLGVLFQGYHTDTALTVGVGKLTPDRQKLLDTTRKSLELAIKNIKPGVKITYIQGIIQKTIEDEGFGVIRELTGHGIGKKLQEPPSIANYITPEYDFILKEGMTLAIEPMVSAGRWQIYVKEDGWTVVTKDGSPTAHFEHTFAVTKNGAEILTKL